MKKLMLFAVFLLLAHCGLAQSNSGISFMVYDEAGLGMINCPVKVYEMDSLVLICYTNEDGKGLVRPLPPGVYELRVEHDSVLRRVHSIRVEPCEVVSVDIDFRPADYWRDRPVILYCAPKNRGPKQSGNSTITDQQLEAMPVW